MGFKVESSRVETWGFRFRVSGFEVWGVGSEHFLGLERDYTVDHTRKSMIVLIILK